MNATIKLSTIATLPKDKISKEEAIEKMAFLVEKLTVLQNKLFAQQRYAVLIIIQGMDTSGKDNAIKHVFSGVNPAGCCVKSFKVPTTEETAHHFLWRISKECPRKGMIQIFNRSHYEDVLVPMIHKTLNKDLLKERYKEINAFERGLIKDNTILLKFYLHISQEEQIERLASRKTEEDKRWKYQQEDEQAVVLHKQYRKAYETIIAACSEAVPWTIIPADKKWYKNYRILQKIIEELERYAIHYPKIEL